MAEPDQTAQAQSAYPARWWHRIHDGRLQCDLCPRDCKLHPGQRGLCFVRQRVSDAQGDRMVLTTWGRSSGFCVDPIEKKPLHHFLPGSRVLSFGTAGCNLACKFCQNWDISKSREMDRLMDQAAPEQIALAAQNHACASVAFTYNDPVIFSEYALDTAAACHALGIKTVAVTAGYVHAQPRREFFAQMDAANVDLKGFNEAFYRQQTGAHLKPVLDTLEYIAHETDCWLEVTTLLIPGLNDGVDEIEAMSRWLVEHLGPEVPLHFTAFHPDYKLNDRPATRPEMLTYARRIARGAGLRYVYVGNVQSLEGGTTFCPHCKTALIVRNGYDIPIYSLGDDGDCPRCGAPIPGRYVRFTRAFGAQRIPVRIGAAR